MSCGRAADSRPKKKMTSTSGSGGGNRTTGSSSRGFKGSTDMKKGDKDPTSNTPTTAATIASALVTLFPQNQECPHGKKEKESNAGVARCLFNFQIGGYILI